MAIIPKLICTLKVLPIKILADVFVNPQFYSQQKCPTGMKTLSDERKLREFIDNSPTLSEMLEVFQAGRKRYQKEI